MYLLLCDSLKKKLNNGRYNVLISEISCSFKTLLGVRVLMNERLSMGNLKKRIRR